MIACDFRSFFHALWGYAPFPWQEMLAERVATGHWPEALDLPTAAGKTACIEVALYALAAQADRPVHDRTAPRRIWFVVDRRIVVDEAHARATQIAEKLASAEGGPLREVADRLRAIGGLAQSPLSVARLRAGVLRDDGWARRPSQPAVITSTVDQLGSRLLFRGYGHSALTASIYAGLAANDSLIVLDEAHCSVPFMHTLRAIQRYRGTDWAAVPVPSPFAFVVLSATPPADIARDAVFPGAKRDKALDHRLLRERLKASKRAKLIDVPTKSATKAAASDPLVDEAAKEASAFVGNGRQRVGVIVNRVRTAEEIHGALSELLKEHADVVLLTGRLRPVERDRLVDRWKPYLRAASPEDPPRPIVLVSTQCLEVGADFSFDALVSEAASLDALRQRFGRLDRMGKLQTSEAAILVRAHEADPDKAEPDPIYGEALARTWKLLRELAADEVIDFGIELLNTTLANVDDLTPYLAPAGDAPVLLPAHLDLLCQTAPRPAPEPDVSLFLHGMERRAPEVQVLWRADLDADDPASWPEIVALCPPLTGEMLSVPLYRLRAFLAESEEPDDAGDVEGQRLPAHERNGAIRPCLVWRGRGQGRSASRVVRSGDDLAPRDVVVLPAAYGMRGLGQTVAAPSSVAGLDLWEAAQRDSGRPPAVRLTRALLDQWSACPAVAALIEVVESPEPDRQALDEAIDAVIAYERPDEEAPEGPPAWWRDLLREARSGDGRRASKIEEHPAGGVIVLAPPSLSRQRLAEPDLFADDDDLTSASGQPVSLDEHSELVRRTVEKIAARCVPESLRPVLAMAGYFHDVGKLDPRFQVMLHEGDELAAELASEPLAKSASIPTSLVRRREIREASGLPENFRHEMLSLQLAERHAPRPEEGALWDLLLHLIASHHGHARPFAPVCIDNAPPAVDGRLGKLTLALSAEERAAATPAHRADSGIADRFWRLVRRHGWWGLSYLEAIVRLGDWYASGQRLKDGESDEEVQG